MRSRFVASMAGGAHLSARYVAHSAAVPAEGGEPVVVARDEVRVIECCTKPRNREFQLVGVDSTRKVEEMPLENIARVQGRSELSAFHLREVVQEADLIDRQ